MKDAVKEYIFSALQANIKIVIKIYKKNTIQAYWY